MAPSKDGVLIGTDFDGSHSYVARGWTACYGATPARVVINGSKSPGTYAVCNGNETMVFKDLNQYLVSTPGYYFSWIFGNSDDHFSNSVRFNGKVYMFMVSRVNETSTNGTSFSTVGRTFLDIGSWFFDPENSTSMFVGKEDVELLVCSTTEGRGGVRAIEAPISNCGDYFLSLI